MNEIKIRIVSEEGEVTERAGDEYVDPLYRAMRDSMTMTVRGWILGLIAESVIEGEFAPDEAKKLLEVIKTIKAGPYVNELVNEAASIHQSRIDTIRDAGSE